MKFLPTCIVAILSFGPVVVAKTKIKTKTKNNNKVEHIATQSRIVGGSDADVDEYPFFVSWQGCGASLIARDMILTAAHCRGQSNNDVKINHSRKYNWWDSGPTPGNGISRRIVERYPHPNYNDYSIDYDYMVMKLNSPVDENVIPIDLNQNNNVPIEDDLLTVIGFGSLSSGGGTPSNLQEVVVEYIETNQCNSFYSYNGDVNDDTMFCAGRDGGGKDSCQGDSGGPIFTRNDDGSFLQVGIVSWGQGCAQASYPGVYSRISGEIDWIKQQVCSNSDYKPEYCDDYVPPAPINNPNPPTPQQTPPIDQAPPANGQVGVRLQLKYDSYPYETIWTFVQNGNQIASYQGGAFDQSQVRTTVTQLEPGQARFRIRDTGNDGICCTYGSGNYEIWAVNPQGDDILLASGNGDYGNGETKQLEIPDLTTPEAPSPPTPSPTFGPTGMPTTLPPIPAPTPQNTNTPEPEETPPLDDVCQDSSTATFNVNRELRNKNCAWLANNLELFEYLCKFLDVGAKCRDTCNSCRYFTRQEL